MKRKFMVLAGLFAMALSTRAEVREVAHYNLQGLGGIRDTAAPDLWKSSAPGGPDLARHGNVKVMSNGPEARRLVYDSSVKFEADDQCYQGPAALANGEHWVLEAWAYGLKANDGGLHTVVANGDGGTGFLLCQDGSNWEVFVGGQGGVHLGQVQPNTWTHLAIVRNGLQCAGYVNGVKVATLPGLSGGAANFGIGATEPGHEPFHGWIAEVRVADFQPEKFDPALDFLMDNQKLKVIEMREMAPRVKLVQSLLRTPGVTPVSEFDEKPATADWLITPPSTHANVQVKAGARDLSAQIMLSNGLVSRTFLVNDNLACVSLRRSDKDMEFIRALKPEVRFKVNGSDWLEVGGLTGTPERGFLSKDWFDNLESKDSAFRFAGMTVGEPVKPYEWQPKCNALPMPWPAPGVRVSFHFAPPANAADPVKDLLVDVNYEIYDGLPVMMKTFTVTNKSGREVTINEINGEYLAVLQDGVPLMHVESDYSFALANWTDQASPFAIYPLRVSHDSPYYAYYLGGGTTRWESDPEYNSQATLNPAEDLFLNNPERCLLVSRPSVGPGYAIQAGGEFLAMRTFEILNDTNEKERSFLAQRRFYNHLAPQTTEYQIELHSATHDVNSLKGSIDQMAETGFERLQIEHPAGISYEDISEGNIQWLKAVCDYAASKGIRVGAYELMAASQDRGAENDCITPGTRQTGSYFGQSGCLCSKWGDIYRTNMFKLIEATGLGSFDPDGPYHGDPDGSTTHPGHKGLEDSEWMQWRAMCDILHQGQRRNLFLTVPDWYFLNGQVCTGMGYREAADNLPIMLQTLVHRQYMFDATYQKTAGMGWMNLEMGTLRGGPENDLAKYEFNLFQLLSYGAQPWLQGGGLYDGPKSKAMVKRLVEWSKRYREIIRGDLIHVCRPDGQSLDYVMHVRPGNKEKGMLLVFNPTAAAISKTIDLPLYYTGLTDTASIREQEGPAKEYHLDREYKVKLPVTLPANGYTWIVIE